MFNNRLTATFLLLLTLALAACALPGTSMPDDGPPVAISEEAAASLEQKVQALATSGSATLTVTQEEISSYLALRLLSEDMPLRQPQIYFRDGGQMVIRGDIEFQGRSQPLRIEATPTLADGKLDLAVSSARVGPLPLPTSIIDQIEGSLGEAILAGQRFGTLTAISVGAGTMTISGERQ